MKRFLSLCLTVCIGLPLAGCSVPVPISGPAEIPVEILGELDSDTRQALTGDRKYIALTFDDGPRADTTGRLLDGLAERSAPCTFFIIGEQVRGNEYLICRMAADGHQIGSHTYSHTRLTTVSPENVVEEIHKTETVLREVTGGEKSCWLRPPYGQIDSQRAKEIKTPMIYWSVDPQDWKLLNTDKVVDAVLNTVQSGDIVLLHDFYSTSVDAALQIIDRLQEQGYVFVTVEDLFRIQGVEPQAGVLYAKPEKIRPTP